jgi:hypothetical protein
MVPNTHEQDALDSPALYVYRAAFVFRWQQERAVGQPVTLEISWLWLWPASCSLPNVQQPCQQSCLHHMCCACWQAAVCPTSPSQHRQIVCSLLLSTAQPLLSGRNNDFAPCLTGLTRSQHMEQHAGILVTLTYHTHGGVPG